MIQTSGRRRRWEPEYHPRPMGSFYLFSLPLVPGLPTMSLVAYDVSWGNIGTPVFGGGTSRTSSQTSRFLMPQDGAIGWRHSGRGRNISDGLMCLLHDLSYRSFPHNFLMQRSRMGEIGSQPKVAIVQGVQMRCQIQLWISQRKIRA